METNIVISNLQAIIDGDGKSVSLSWSVPDLSVVQYFVVEQYDYVTKEWLPYDGFHGILSSKNSDVDLNPPQKVSFEVKYPGTNMSFRVRAISTNLNEQDWVYCSAEIKPVGLTAGTIGGINISGNSITAGDLADLGFSLNADGTLFAKNAVIDGEISASLGTIGGWTIGEATILSGGIVLAASLNAVDNKIYVGSGTFNNANTPFYIDGTGRLSLKDKLFWDGTNLAISGSVTATSGSIGGWNIGTAGLTSGGIKLIGNSTAAENKVCVGAGNFNNLDTPFYVDGTGRFSLKDQLTWNGDTLVVAGSMSAKTGTIGGWGISENDIYAIKTGVDAPEKSTFVLNKDGKITSYSDRSALGTGHTETVRVEMSDAGIVLKKDALSRIIMNDQGVQCIKDGSVLGSAITPDGLIGTLLTVHSVPGSAFDMTAPPVPDGSSVEFSTNLFQNPDQSYGILNILWNEVSDTGNDLAGYKIYLREEESELIVPMALVPLSAPKDSVTGKRAYRIDKLKPNQTYFVSISSYDKSNNESSRCQELSCLMPPDDFAPHKIENLRVTDSVQSIAIAYDISSLDVDIDYIEIQRRDERWTGPLETDWEIIDYRTIASIAKSNVFIDKNVRYDTVYKYRVAAVDYSGNGGSNDPAPSNWSDELVVGEPEKLSTLADNIRIKTRLTVNDDTATQRFAINHENPEPGSYVVAGSGYSGLVEIGIPYTVNNKSFLSLNRAGLGSFQMGMEGQDLVMGYRAEVTDTNGVPVPSENIDTPALRVSHSSITIGEKFEIKYNALTNTLDFIYKE